jgi:cytochrome b subunit of formate dehydrogenase
MTSAPTSARWSSSTADAAFPVRVGSPFLLVAGLVVVALAGNRAAHNISAIAIIALVSGHLYMAVLNRGMRGALGGIVTGRVDARWAAEHHPAWRPEDPQPSPSSPSTASGSLNGGTR